MGYAVRLGRARQIFFSADSSSHVVGATAHILLELERKDGVQRHFEYDWQVVARYNSDYLRYVEGGSERLGEGHPLFQPQYCLLPLSGSGGFLCPSQKAQLQGDHHRRSSSRDKGVYVAGIDLDGEAEEGRDAHLRAIKPRQDSTVVTIGEM